jgi:PAS domain S-box-containing protein
MKIPPIGDSSSLDQSWFVRYAVAVAAIALAVLLRLSLDPWLGAGAFPFVTQVVAVVTVAWYAGIGPAALALVLGALGAFAFIVSRADPSPPQAIGGLVLYLVVSTACALLGESMRRARRRADASADSARVSAEHLELLSNTVPALISYIGLDGRYRSCNSAYTRWFGLAREKIVGQSVREILGEDAWRAIGDSLERALAGETVHLEAEVPYLHGGTRWIQAVYTPHLDSGGAVVGVVALVTDISHVKKAQEALRQADRRKDEFLAILAHELRNPLAPISTGVQLLRRDGAEPRVRDRVLPIMTRQVANLVRMIDDLLDVSRITAGRIVLQRRPTAVGELIQDAIDANRHDIAAAGLALEIDVPSQSCLLDVDPTRFAQVVSNLLHNAIKFTDRGGQVRVSATVDGACSTLALTVADTGVGIPSEVLPRVFDMFAQGAPPSGRVNSGLGIGLAIAQQLITLQGGTIEAASQGLGCGSAFTIRMPLLPSATDQDVPATPAGHQTVPRRVLIIDDNMDAAETLSLLVTTLGGQARCANSGEEGLTVARGFCPDLVLLDIGLPGIDGYETCRLLRAEAGLSKCTVAALSGLGQAEDKRKALSAGFDIHITKPADPALLERLLAAAE